MLYLIGLGLNDENDIALKSLEALKNCDEIYCELFTNKWHGDLKKLEAIIGKKITVLNRTETESDLVIKKATSACVALLVPGDPLAATTHFSLFQEARQKGIETKIIHASSIFTAIAECGLHLYKFGRTVTLCTEKKGFAPSSPIEQIDHNAKEGLHTLILLDVDQENNKYMSIKDALALLAKHNKKYANMRMIAACCLGSDKQKIKYGAAAQLEKEEFDEPAVLIIPGKLHFSEEEALELWK